MKRKHFLNTLAVGAAGLAFNSCSKESDTKVTQSGTKPIIISTWVHGLEANRAAFETLKSGKSILDAVEAGVRVTESDTTNRSVGIGGRPDRDGRVTLDACIMNHNSECGAVAYLQNIENPISVARKVMEDTPHVMLVGDGAEKFANEKGFISKNLLLPEVKKDWEEWKASELLKKPEINVENHDTIGLIGMDTEGNLAGACTTSGWAYKMPGRVGDSPLIGAGLFVDNEVGAACATGMGEAVVRVSGSAMVVELMRQGYTPTDACKEVVDRIKRKHDDLKGLQVGFIALNKEGVAGGYSMYAGFNYAKKTNNFDNMVDTKYNFEWE